MPQETAFLTERAVLWEIAGHAADGEIKVKAPVEIAIRWESGTRETLTSDGQELLADATVMVAQPVKTGSLMRYGKLKTLPDPIDGLRVVANYEDIPDIKGRDHQRTVTLARYGKELPEIVEA